MRRITVTVRVEQTETGDAVEKSITRAGVRPEAADHAAGVLIADVLEAVIDDGAAGLCVVAEAIIAMTEDLDFPNLPPSSAAALRHGALSVLGTTEELNKFR